MAGPNPSTTNWVPIGPQGGIGPVGPNGAAGPQGPAGSGLPSPVVDGQWIKGSGGAAVWSPITAADIPQLATANMPGQLGGNGGVSQFPPPNSDWNQVVANGWYMMAGGANAPDSNWWIGSVVIHNSAWQIQTLYGFTQYPAPMFTRQQFNGTWQAWRRLSENFVQGNFQPDITNYGGGTYPPCGHYINAGICTLQGLATCYNDIQYTHYVFQPGSIPPPADGCTHIFSCFTSQGVRRFDVQPQGIFLYMDGPTIPNGSWITLDGVSYVCTI